MPKDDGGPAWPIVSNGWGVKNARGMSLRDWFAGMALTDAVRGKDWVEPEKVAKWCYLLADAMIVERERRHD